MKQLVNVIKRDAQYLGDGIVKMDSFLNHQVDVDLCEKMGKHFAKAFNAAEVGGITKVITAETSGIPAALFTAREYGVPMLFAKKHVSAVMDEVYYFAKTISRTKGNETNLFISKRFIDETDRVLIIDDFLATGNTLRALSHIITESGALLAGLGAIIEKPQEEGRKKLAHLTAPIISLAKVTWQGNEMSVE